MMFPSMSPATSPSTCVDAVYVHAPFCARRCFYCDFAVTVSRTGDLPGWIAALSGELDLLARNEGVELSTPLDTLYVGGGTPSLLGPEAMTQLRLMLGEARIADSTEFTAEANPESFTREVADGWRRAGLTRLSLGTQSFQPGVLRWMGRLHGAEGTAKAVAQARDADITNLSVDLIFGLPVEVERDWVADLDAVLALEVPHLSLYGLTAEPSTPLRRRVDEGRITMPDDQRYRDEFLLAHERLTAAGYEHYEVSNFALPGFRSRHNAQYWTGRPYVGLGNGAHGFVPPQRRWNLRDWHDYSDAVRQGRSPVDASEQVTGEAARLEEIWLGLRTDRGLALGGLNHEARSQIDRWVGQRLARIVGVGAEARVVLTAEGWLMLDELAVELDANLAPGVES
jgi:oxygen-independent coproporphyrinogen-3 oxidase